MTKEQVEVTSDDGTHTIATISTKVIVILIAAFVLGGLSVAATVGALVVKLDGQSEDIKDLERGMERMQEKFEEKFENLRTQVVSSMDDRWRKKDHDDYALKVDERIDKLEVREHLTRAEIEEMLNSRIYPWSQDKAVVNRRLDELERILRELRKEIAELRKEIAELKKGK